MTVLYWSDPKAIGKDSFIFKFNNPSHVVLRDLTLQGEPDENLPDGIGGAILAEVNDVPGSRVLTSALSAGGGGITVAGIGNVPFDNRALQINTATILGNNRLDAPGFFSFFGGNPAEMTVGSGANLIVQDTWYEGPASRYITCLDSANVTLQSSTVAMGGWHGNIPDTKTTFNLEDCQTQTAILSSDIIRDIKDNVSPSVSLNLPASSTENTNLLMHGLLGDSSNFGSGHYAIPTGQQGVTNSLDQAFFTADPASRANYLFASSLSYQLFADNSGLIPSWTFQAKNQGHQELSLVRSALTQTLDPARRAPRLVSTITDPAKTDIQTYHVNVKMCPLGVQFVLPEGTPATPSCCGLSEQPL